MVGGTLEIWTLRDMWWVEQDIVVGRHKSVVGTVGTLVTPSSKVLGIGILRSSGWLSFKQWEVHLLNHTQKL